MAQITITGTVKDLGLTIPTSGTLSFQLSDYLIDSAGDIVPVDVKTCNISGVDGSFSITIGSTQDAIPSTRSLSVSLSAVIAGVPVTQSLPSIQLAASPSSVLLKDLIISGLSGGTAVTPTLSAADVSLTLKETDQSLPAGLWRLRVNGDTFTLEKNTAVAGDFSTLNTFLSLSSTGIWTFTKTAVGVTSTDGLVLQNTTAAAVGAQQYSPRLRLTGQGWKTTATAASQTVDFILENQPIQGAANPSANLVISSQINGAGYSALLTLSSAGVITGPTWNGAVIGAGYGGTGLSAFAVGDLIYASATTPTLARLADVATGSVLISGGVNTAPAWSSTPTFVATNVTGLPISTGVSGLAAGIATFLATPSSANLGSALTDKTGTGVNVFANTPTLITPVIGAATGTSLALTGTFSTSGVGPHAIGAAVNAVSQLFIGGTFAGDNSLFIGPTITPPAGDTGRLLWINGTITKAGSGTHPIFAGLFIQDLIVNTGLATVTTGASQYIRGSSSGASTNLALWVDTAGGTNGNVRFSQYGAGTATFDASGNFSSVSDERLKTINRAFDPGLAELLQIQPIVYRWKPSSGLDTEHDYAGFSAQNLRACAPQAADLLTGTDSHGFYTLQDRGVLAMIVNGVKQLKGQHDDEITALKARVQQLERGN